MRRAFGVIAVVAALTAVGAAPANAGSKSPKEVAKAGTIVATDVGAGFSTSPADDSADKKNDKLAQKIKSCKNYTTIRESLDTATDAQSPDFQSSAEVISNHVYVFKKEAAAKKIIKLAEKKGMADCFTDLFTKIFAKALKGNSQVDDFRVLINDVPNVADIAGDETVGFSGGVEVKGTDGSVDQRILSTLLVRVGPAILAYSYQALPNQNTGALDAALDNSVLRTQIALA